MEKTINGKTVKIAFNLATEITYERITGKAFDYAKIFNREKPDSTEIAHICCACLLANNADTFEPNDFMLAKSRKEVKEIIEAVLKAMTEWLDIPAIAEAHAIKGNDEEPLPNQ